MQINDITDAFYWWLEEIPVEELSCEIAQEIVRAYKCRDIDVVEAGYQLEFHCEEVIRDWIIANKELKNQLKK